MNKVQELQQKIDQLNSTVVSLQIYQPNPNYSHARLKRKQYEQSLQRIDWSLNRNAGKIKAVPVLCECGRCVGNLLDWPGRSTLIWNKMPGACPYRVGIQLTRIALHRREDIDPFIISKLLKVSQQ